MSDDKSQRGGQDRRRIDVNEPYELRDWALRFGVSKEELKAAVATVGDLADEVQRYLQRGRS
jgi:hypothetical protein